MLNLWSWRGRVGRKQYLTTGLILFFVKHNLDWHLWSDQVIETIHKRVLLHIKTLAENDSR